MPDTSLWRLPPTAAQEPHSQVNSHLRLAARFQLFGLEDERLLPAKLKVSFPLFGVIHAVPVSVGYGSVEVSGRENRHFFARCLQETRSGHTTVRSACSIPVILRLRVIERGPWAGVELVRLVQVLRRQECSMRSCRLQERQDFVISTEYDQIGQGVTIDVTGSYSI